MPHNVIRGQFAATEEVNWAVLCSQNDSSVILVFRAASPTTPEELARRSDGGFLQHIGEGRIGYSRAIGVADSAYIREHFDRYGGPTPPPLEHDGINDMFVEKGSHVWYLHDGHWLRLTGAD